MAAINLAAFCFGSTALYGKLAVSPFWIVAARAAFATVTLLGFVLWRKETVLPPRGLRIGLLSTGIILAIHWTTFFAAVQLAGIAVATLTFAVFPLFTVLIETHHKKRKPYVAELAAAAAILAAVALLVTPHSTSGTLWGAGTGLISALTFAWFGHAGKQLGQTLSPLRVSVYLNGVVTVVLIPVLFFARPVPVGAAAWLWLAMLGIFSTALMHQLYFYALNRLSAATCSGFVALEPVYALLLAALVFGEPITGWILLSGALILGASFALLKLESV